MDRSSNSPMSIWMRRRRRRTGSLPSALDSSVLPTPEGPAKMNAAGRALGVLQPGAGAADRLGDGHHGVGLTDDPLVDLVLHAQQPGGLGLGELDHRMPVQLPSTSAISLSSTS